MMRIKSLLKTAGIKCELGRKVAVFPRRYDAEMDTANLLHASA